MNKHQQNIMSYKKGGIVKKTGLAKVHKGEKIIAKTKRKKNMLAKAAQSFVGGSQRSA